MRCLEFTVHWFLPSQVEVLGVSYNWSEASLSAWETWSSKLGAQFTPLITNPEWSKDPAYVGNDHYEFGAYAAAEHMARTIGPYILVNDTLLIRHAKYVWQRILKSVIIKKGQILVDSFPAPHERPKEIPSPYASSWIFVIADFNDLVLFCSLVKRVISEPLEPSTPEYTAFLNRWLHSSIPWKGYQGKSSNHDLQRKLKTIQWEHKLSVELHEHQVFMSFWGWRYELVRYLDRILRRFY